ncbi:MAG: hydroxymethylbilane synthase [Lachnospiraceae bacterium]|nr:hydroxymethylbilane synthase [Lachnospiraceae bacterium]
MTMIKVGTRTSALAMKQTELVIDAVKEKNQDISFEIVPIKTKGDKLLSVSLADFGGKGAFVTEFEEALLDGTIDLAVHSAKDIPMELSEGLEIWAALPRADARDVLLTRKGQAAKELRIVGTSSKRRELQIKELYGVQCALLRGNVPTRIEKLKNDMYDGIILAAAGIDRLGLSTDEDLDYRYFSVDEMIPAGGQGIIVLEGRKNDGLKSLFTAVKDENAEIELETERFILNCLQAGCHEPVGVYSRVEGNQITISLFLEREGKARRGTVKGETFKRLQLAGQLIDEVKHYEG